MALQALNKINGMLKFLYHKNKFLIPTLRRMLCNTIIQPHFDYVCSAWYPNLNEKLKKKIQINKTKENTKVYSVLAEAGKEIPYIQQRV